ncbi:hypothetical protein BALCAV_0220910 [Alkalihalobacillus alcalophilus ATCC 27647 = CGMCC 1.3604]|uniref:Cell division protein FtsW n=1 Tax=Alkalihalobacillus alcalophilus ATCC 27647 = CGMCC 1.3604 TaxID=1218173 RepID=A0A094WFY4_ALKAL|nr:permease prefix domain 1-containing protein [Alkalihalobacillus alcalophilus]KGA95686.1 hypothetical protein BALCAV_0220910 [Alkalihalobacillus alcalophilus ATCC 27647 = CGMCC 1.3604]
MTTKSFDAFLTRVTEQMKSKEGKHLVQKELHSHLLQSKKANMRAGYSEGEAEVNAISRMGDPVQLGKKMNKLHRPLIDWWMLALVGGLFLLSFVPFLLVDIQAMRVELQLLSVFISFIFMFSLMLIDFRKILTKWKWFLGVAIFYIIFFCLGTITELPYMYYSFGLLKFEIFGVRIPHQWFLMLIFIGLVGYISNVQINSYKQLIPLFIIMWFPILLIGKHLGPFLSILLVMITLTVVAFSSLTKN